MIDYYKNNKVLKNFKNWNRENRFQAINNHYICTVNIQSKHIQNAVDQITTLPGIGKRTALRLVLNLLKRNEEEVKQFTSSINALHENVVYCFNCHNISDSHLCDICSNPNRDHSTICVVEDIRDIMAIESTQAYQGVYHVLGGIISPMDGIGPAELNITTLVEKIKQQTVEEVIFALSATMEGDTTNFYLYKKLNPFDLKITTLSRGVSVGSELQYADELTLSRSIEHRHPYSYK